MITAIKRLENVLRRSMLSGGALIDEAAFQCASTSKVKRADAAIETCQRGGRVAGTPRRGRDIARLRECYEARPGLALVRCRRLRRAMGKGDHGDDILESVYCQLTPISMEAV